jgi:protein-tyrosine-phosphatase
MNKLGLDQIVVNTDTAQPWEEQWWEQFDAIMDLSEEEMRREVPFFVADPRNQAQVQALLEGRAHSKETTQQLQA